MPRAVWPLLQGRPTIEVIFTMAIGGSHIRRVLLADTGAGAQHSVFEAGLGESECVALGGLYVRMTQIRGSFSGLCPVYAIRLQLPQLGFDSNVHVVGLKTVPPGVDGIAG